MSNLRFTLVTTCKNEINSITNWMSDINHQTRQPDEISIVDAFSQDGTWEVLTDWARNDSRVKLDQIKGSPAIGRNKAIENSSNEIIVSTDMGCSLNIDWIEKICQPFIDNPEIQAVAGNYSIEGNKITTSAAWAAYYLQALHLPHKKNGYLPSNRSIAYKKSAWEKMGKLPEDLTFAADDTVFSLILLNSDIKIAYALDANVYWHRMEKWSDYNKESYRYGFGNGEAALVPSILHNTFVQKYVNFFSAYYIASQLKPNILKKIFLAALNGKILASLYIIPVQITLGYYRFLGLRDGFINGKSSCKKTRQRLDHIGITHDK